MLFKECKLDGSYIMNAWSCALVDATNNFRVFYLPESADEKKGFKFAVFRFDASSGDAHDVWADPSLEVTCIMHGYAYECLKHLYFQEEDSETNINQIKSDGYSYYPDPLVMIKIWTILQELESLYCSQPSTNDYKVIEDV